MTEFRREWIKYMQQIANIMCEMHVELMPFYIEAVTFYEYEMEAEDGTKVPIYDIPFSSLAFDGQDAMDAITKMVENIDEDDIAWVIRKPSDASNGLPSILIPKELCRTIQIDEITGIIIDNNANHLGNPFVSAMLDCIQETVTAKLSEMRESE